MSYRDEMESLTGVPLGHTAFTSVPPKAQPDTKTAPGKRGPRKTKPDPGAVQSAVVAKDRAANPRHGTLYGISRVSDERITAHKARETAIIAKKNVSTFNVQIPSADESRRTQSIGGKL